jgi:hypoxanthine phosphoribosyltransferase
MDSDQKKIKSNGLFISLEEIQKRVEELADTISKDYAGRNPVIITLLKGAFIFSADLIRRLTIKHEVDFITLSSYQRGIKRSKQVEVKNHLNCDINNRDVIIVDEIVETGHTLCKLIQTLSSHEAKSLKICALLDKPSSRQVEVTVNYTGFEIPDVFVVGYGLDYKERYRGLPYIIEIPHQQNYDSYGKHDFYLEEKDIDKISAELKEER